MQCGSAKKPCQVGYGGVGNKVYLGNTLKLFITIDIQIGTPSLWEGTYLDYQEFLFQLFEVYSSIS